MLRGDVGRDVRIFLDGNSGSLAMFAAMRRALVKQKNPKLTRAARPWGS